MVVSKIRALSRKPRQNFKALCKYADLEARDMRDLVTLERRRTRRSSTSLLHRKHLTDLAMALRVEQSLLRRGAWTRKRICQFQQQRLEQLVEHAVRHSPFYRDHYRHTKIAKPLDLSALPIVTKQMVMENFDQVITNRALRLSNLLTHLSNLQTDEYYANRYRCVLSSGTTGLQGLFVFNRREWATIIAAMRRASAIMSERRRIPDGPVATIGSATPAHLSHRIALCLAADKSGTPILTTASGIATLANTLNDLQPRVLRTYPSVIDLLAIEQSDGRLHINPRLVSTFGEVLTTSTVQGVRDVWGVTPFNSFAMTEGLFGAECRFHKGLHFFDDLGILEITDEHGRIVDSGQPGRKLLVTNLYNYTQPLIRYEVSDMATVARHPCPCGNPFTLISQIDGRNEDVLTMVDERGELVALHPGLLRGAISAVTGVKQFQVTWQPTILNIKVVLRPSAIAETVTHEIRRSLRIHLETNRIFSALVDVDIVDKLDSRNKLGKSQVVIRDDSLKPLDVATRTNRRIN